MFKSHIVLTLLSFHSARNTVILIYKTLDLKKIKKFCFKEQRLTQQATNFQTIFVHTLL